MAEGIRIGGGKNYGANVWRRLFTKPAMTTTISIASATYDSTNKVFTWTLESSNADYPVSDLTADDLVGLYVYGRPSTPYNFMYFQLGENGIVEYKIGSGSFSNKGTYIYNPSTGEVTLTLTKEAWPEANWTGNTVTVTREEIPKDYIVNDDSSVYPNGDFHTDGYYYELIGSISSANVMSLSDTALMTVQQDYRDTIETEVSDANA